MPRRNRRGLEEVPELDGLAERILGPESSRLEGFSVRSSTNKLKRYKCPYCGGWVEPGSRHLVAVPEGEPEDRRHYHTGCWAKQVRVVSGRAARG